MNILKGPFNCPNPKCDEEQYFLSISQKDGMYFECRHCGHTDIIGNEIFFPKGWEVIVKNDFRAYVVVQLSGCTNMIHTTNVKLLSRWKLNEQTIYAIIEHYDKLANMWPDVLGSEDVAEEARNLFDEEGQIG